MSAKDIIRILSREARGSKKKAPGSPALILLGVDALFYICICMRISTAFELEACALRCNWASLGRLSGIKLHRDI